MPCRRASANLHALHWRSSRQRFLSLTATSDDVTYQSIDCMTGKSKRLVPAAYSCKLVSRGKAECGSPTMLPSAAELTAARLGCRPARIVSANRCCTQTTSAAWITDMSCHLHMRICAAWHSLRSLQANMCSRHFTHHVGLRAGCTCSTHHWPWPSDQDCVGALGPA